MRATAAARTELAAGMLSGGPVKMTPGQLPADRADIVIGIFAVASVSLLGLDQGAVLVRLGRAVAAGDVHLDVAEAALGEVRLQLAATASSLVMSGTSRMSIFASARSRQDRLAAGPGIAADQALDVDRRLRREPVDGRSDNPRS